MLGALKERDTVSELAQRYQLHPTQVSTWKREFLDGAEQVLIPFGSRNASEDAKLFFGQAIQKTVA